MLPLGAQAVIAVVPKIPAVIEGIEAFRETLPENLWLLIHGPFKYEGDNHYYLFASSPDLSYNTYNKWHVRFMTVVRRIAEQPTIVVLHNPCKVAIEGLVPVQDVMSKVINAQGLLEDRDI